MVNIMFVTPAKSQLTTIKSQEGAKKKLLGGSGQNFKLEKIGNSIRTGPWKTKLDEALNIWSKVIRMHIGLIICHFLVSAVSITESQKNKIMGKTGFYGLSACRGSAVE